MQNTGVHLLICCSLFLVRQENKPDTLLASSGQLAYGDAAGGRVDRAGYFIFLKRSVLLNGQKRFTVCAAGRTLGSVGRQSIVNSGLWV